MKAQDLRIGNLIIIYSKESPAISETHLVEPTTLMMLLNTISSRGMAFEPIQLTEEWLLKMGFLPSRLNIKNYFHPSTILFELRNVSVLDGGFKIRIGVDEAFSFKAISTEIQFVHQLQNLYFALTGEELDIKL